MKRRIVDGVAADSRSERVVGNEGAGVDVRNLGASVKRGPSLLLLFGLQTS